MARILEANQNILAEFANNFMGNVVVSPNIKKTSARIDPAGNIIDAKTKQIIQPIEPEYVPPPTTSEVTGTPQPLEVKQDSMSDKINKMVEAKIAEKIDAIVAERVNAALKNL